MTVSHLFDSQMAYRNDIKSIENKYSETASDKFIKENQTNTGKLPERQFNCPPCMQSEKSSCQIPSWMKPPCDGL